jgi:hypothetical protein
MDRPGGVPFRQLGSHDLDRLVEQTRSSVVVGDIEGCLDTTRQRTTHQRDRGASGGVHGHSINRRQQRTLVQGDSIQRISL